MKEVIIHLICADQKGIIACFTNKLYKNKINIISLEQHIEPDENIFFMRIHADIKNMILDENEFAILINEFKKEINAEIHWYDYLKPLNMVIMCTKEEGPVLELILKQKAGKLNCNIPAIISNHEFLSDLSVRHNIDYHCFSINKKEAQEKKILDLLDSKEVDLIVLARYMQILSSDFVSKYPNKIINIHHGFLPAFKGSKPYHRAWKKGVKMIGATAHYVTSELDEGPIIEQDVESVTHHFSVEELIETGRDIERKVLSLAVQAHLEHKILIHKKRTIIFH